MRLPRIFFITTFLVCATDTFRLWFIAPAIMAAHFNVQGLPDRFDAKGSIFYLEIQIMLIILAAVIVTEGLIYILPIQAINLPNREYWLAPERRAATIARVGSFSEIIFGSALIVMQVAFELAISANLHTPIVFAAQYLIPVIFGFLLFNSIALILFALSFRLPVVQ